MQSENKKENDDEIDYIDKGTDAHIIKQFCIFTNSTEKIAIAFLDESINIMHVMVYLRILIPLKKKMK